LLKLSDQVWTAVRHLDFLLMLFWADWHTEIIHSYRHLLWGRGKWQHCVSCPSVCLFVRRPLARAPNWRIKRRKNKIGVNVSKVTVMPILAQKVKKQAESRTICRH